MTHDEQVTAMRARFWSPAKVSEVQKHFAAAKQAGQISTDGFRWNTTGGAESDALNKAISRARKQDKKYYCADCDNSFARALKHGVCAKCYATMQRAGG